MGFEPVIGWGSHDTPLKEAGLLIPSDGKQEYALAVDEIAERIRAVGARAPGSYTEFAEIASVKEDRGSPSAMEMIANLAADQEATVASARKTVEVAEAAGDQPTANLRVRRIEAHEKNAWML